MPTCAECVYAEFEGPPFIIKCSRKGTFHYLDSAACKEFKPAEHKKC